MCDTTDAGQRCYVCNPGPLEDGPADPGFHKKPPQHPRVKLSRDPLQRSLWFGLVHDRFEEIYAARAQRRAGE